MSDTQKWSVWFSHSIDNRVHFLKDDYKCPAEMVSRADAERVFLSLCDDKMLAVKQDNAYGGWYSCVTTIDGDLVDTRTLTMTPVNR